MTRMYGIRGLVGFVCCCSLSVTTYANDLSDLKGMSVRLCGTPAYPPVSWVTPDGHVEGVNADIIRALFEPLGVIVDDLQNSNWHRCLKEVELGNVDVVSGFRNEARKQFVTYLDTPLISESIHMYYPIDSPITFESWSDMADWRIGVLMGDSFGDGPDEALKGFSHLEWVSTQDQNLLKLADGRLDAVPMGKLSGQLQIATLGLEGLLGDTPTNVTDFWYIAVSKKSPLMPWFDEINARLKQLVEQPDFIAGLLDQQQALYLQTMQQKQGEH